ncbi:MAG: MFS transporter [Pseudomonadales bacterium]|jgi:predicted MFS family arabinose efflux permease
MSQALIGLSAVYMVRMLGLFMVLPVLSLALDAYPDANAQTIGWALGIYGASQGILQLPLAAWSDRIGRKPIIIGGLLIFILGSVIAGFSDSVWGIILGRALQGAGAIAATVMALLADLTPEDKRARAMASIGASIGVAFALAMVLGPWIYHMVGLSGLFYAGALLAVVAILLVVLVVPSPPERLLHNDVKAAGIRAVLTGAELLRAALGVFVLHGALMAIFLVVPTVLANYDLVTQAQLSWFYLLIIGTSFVAMLPLIILAEVKRRMRAALRVAVLVLLAATAVLFTSASIEWLVLGLWLFFVGFNLSEALLPSLVSKIAPAGRRGAAMGVFSTAQFTGAFFGAVIAGSAVAEFGPQAAYAVAFGGMALWGLFISFMAPVRYLTNVSWPVVVDTTAEELASLGEIDGVESVRFDAASQRVYLKVDKPRFDSEQVDLLLRP